MYRDVSAEGEDIPIGCLQGAILGLTQSSPNLPHTSGLSLYSLYSEGKGQLFLMVQGLVYIHLYLLLTLFSWYNKPKNKNKKTKNRHTDWKGRDKSVLIYKLDNPLHRKSQGVHKNTIKLISSARCPDRTLMGKNQQYLCTFAGTALRMKLRK